MSLIVPCSLSDFSVTKEPPKHLYRYIALAGAGLFLAERTILHHEIYLTSPVNLNDPFDCMVALDFEVLIPTGTSFSSVFPKGCRGTFRMRSMRRGLTESSTLVDTGREK